MFAFEHWADWTLQKVPDWTRDGAEAAFTFTDESKASDNPAFFVDLDTAERIGRIIIWSDASYDVDAIDLGTEETIQIAAWPRTVTDQNFEEVLDRFIALICRRG